MKNLKFVAALGAAALMLGACSGNSDDSSDTSSGDATTAAEQIDYTACLVSDAGGWDDKSFNQSAMEGLQQAVSELGVKENDAESTSSTDFEPNVQAMVDSNCNLIIGVGFNLADAIGAAAVANSGVDFALVDSTFSDDYAGDNTRALVFNTQEAAYLAGYAQLHSPRPERLPPLVVSRSHPSQSSWTVLLTASPSTTKTTART